MEEQQPKPSGSKIGNTEWGLVIGAVAFIDISQAALDWLLIGPFVNWLIDIFVGMSLALYFYLRGVKMDKKKVGSFITTFLLEIFGIGLDSIPLWTVDVVIIMVLDKGDKMLKEVVPLVGKADKLSTGVRNKFKKTGNS